MKTNRIELKTSDEDEAILKMAAEKFEKQTGKKAMTSRTIMAALDQYAKPEPILFYCNQQAINEVQANVEYGLTAIQQFYDQFFEVTGIRLTLEELQTVLAGCGKMYGIALLTESIEKMCLEKKYAEYLKRNPGFSAPPIEQMEKTDVSSLIDLAAGFYCPDVQNRFVGLQWTVYGLDEGKIYVMADQVEKLFTAHRSFAITPIEHEKLALVKELCSVLNRFLKYNDVSTPHQFQIPYVAHYDVFSNTFKPHEQFVKYTLNFRTY